MSGRKEEVPLAEADPWTRSSVTEARLEELVAQGLLRRRTSNADPEWIVPGPSEDEPKPPEGYVVSFMEYHRRGFGVPASRFFRAILFHFGIELQHLPPNSISQAAIFATLCEGFLGIDPHWDLFLWYFKAELNSVASSKGKSSTRKAVRAGGCVLHLRTLDRKGVNRMEEYIVSRLTSSNKDWQRGWFYLRNDENEPPVYRGHLRAPWGQLV